MERTTTLNLPYILPSQAQKHVTHNEALRMLDALVQIRLAGHGHNTPPEAPADGARYGVGTTPVGVFSGHAGKVAAFQDGAWVFFAPAAGWVAWDATAGKLIVFNGAAWIPAFDPQGMPLLGVNTAADTINRLAVAAAATLFTHAGAGHQVKVNKATAGDTASLLFQSGWSGRAEMGLAGNDDFSVKVSPDGAAWRSALCIDRTNGRIGVGVDLPTTALDVTGIVRASGGFRIGEATLQNGANAHQLNTSAHFSTSGLFAIGTTPLSNNYLRIHLPDTASARRAIYAYSYALNQPDGIPLFVVKGDGATGVGVAEPHTSAALDVVSTNRGFLPPRLTQAQRDAISTPAEGLIIYNTTTHEPQFWNGSSWIGMARG